jgi:hypothetical protein
LLTNTSKHNFNNIDAMLRFYQPVLDGKEAIGSRVSFDIGQTWATAAHGLRGRSRCSWTMPGISGVIATSVSQRRRRNSACGLRSARAGRACSVR